MVFYYFWLKILAVYIFIREALPLPSTNMAVYDMTDLNINCRVFIKGCRYHTDDTVGLLRTLSHKQRLYEFFNRRGIEELYCNGMDIGYHVS